MSTTQLPVDLIAADPNVAESFREFLRSGPHAVIARGSERWDELRQDIAREVDNDAVGLEDES